MDDLIDEEITFVKMDIEGAEMDALAGMKRLLQLYRPRLALSIYHKDSDLWEIPLFIKSVVPEYRLWVRHHSDNCSETILYAEVPS